MALADNLLGYWKLDESSGNATDSSGNGRTATLNGGVTYAAGKLNNGASIPTTSSAYLSIAAFSQGIANNYTISAWFKTTYATASQAPMIFGEDQPGTQRTFQFGMNDTGDGKMRFLRHGSSTVAVSNLTSPAGYNDGDWHHMVGTFDSAVGTKLYLDGVLVASDTQTETNNNGTSIGPTIGQLYPGFGNDSWGGMVDEIGFWNRTLSYSEVLQIHNSGRANAYPFTATPSLYGATHFYSYDSSNSTDIIGQNNGTDTSITYSSGNGKLSIGGGYASGSSSKISYPAMGYAATDSISWGGWVNLTTLGTDRAIFSNSDSGTSWGCLLRYDHAATKFIAAVVTTGQQTATGTTTPSTGTWYHVMAVWTSGSHIKLYVNGAEEGSTNTANTSLRGPTGTWLTGSFSGSNFMDGAIDEIGFWNRALSSTEIGYLYNSGSGLAYPWAISTTSIKTLDGLAYASTKTVDGLAIASVKTVMGLA